MGHEDREGPAAGAAGGGEHMMIHWMWAVGALAVGAIIGLFLAAMI